MDLVVDTFSGLGIDLGNDSSLQPLWNSVRPNHRDSLRSPLFPIVLTVSSYFVFCLSFLACDIIGDRWPWVQSSRSSRAGGQHLPCYCIVLASVCISICSLCFLQVWLSGHEDHRWHCQTKSQPYWSSWVMGNLLLFDFQYFIWHLLHHWLYIMFHAIHHNYSAPFVLATQCLGGWELVSVLLDHPESCHPEMPPSHHVGLYGAPCLCVRGGFSLVPISSDTLQYLLRAQQGWCAPLWTQQELCTILQPLG